MQYRIGEFSRITGLSIKALRLYHDEGLLTPDYIDEDSGYRYYSEEKISTGFLISRLRELGFSLKEVGAVLSGFHREEGFSSVSHIFEKGLQESKMLIRKAKERERMLRSFIREELDAETNMPAEKQNKIEEVEYITPGPWEIISHRFSGRYIDVGQHFGRLYRLAGRHALGPAGSFYYDTEYKEEDADIECFIILKKKIQLKDPSYATVRTIPEFRAISLIHHGAYDRLGRSYERIFHHVQEHNEKYTIPTGELYLKGPGIFFRGNPERYRTRIFLPLDKSLAV